MKAETILEAGEPYELTCNAVQKNNINLLVIGNTSINGTLKRLGNFFLTFKNHSDHSSQKSHKLYEPDSK